MYLRSLRMDCVHQYLNDLAVLADSLASGETFPHAL